MSTEDAGNSRKGFSRREFLYQVGAGVPTLSVAVANTAIADPGTIHIHNGHQSLVGSCDEHLLRRSKLLYRQVSAFDGKMSGGDFQYHFAGYTG